MPNALILLVSLLMMAAGADRSAQQRAPKTFQPSTKLVRDVPWRDFKFRLLVPEASGAKSAIIEIDAKLTSYRVPGAGYSFTIVVLYDPHSKRTCVMPGIPRFPSFYVSADTGVLGVNLGPEGIFQWVRSFVEIPGPALDLDQAERRFEREFDETKASQHLARAVSLDVTRATGLDFFAQQTSFAAQLDVRADIAGSNLHLDMANPKVAKTAALWIDLRAARIVRAIDTSGLERRNVASTKVWRTITGKLMHSGAGRTGATSQPIEVVARSANFYVLGTNQWFSVVALTDPVTKRIVFINGAEYFVSTSTGLMGVSIFGGTVTVRRRVLEMSGNGDISATLDRFARAFDPAALRRAEREDNRIRVAEVIGDSGFFIRGSQPIFPPHEQVGISDGILHFVLVNPDTGQRAACRVDIRPGSVFLERVVRVEVEGQARPIPSPWVDGKARLVTPGKPARLEELREVDARYTNLLGSEPRLAVVHDAPNKTISIVDGFRDYYRSQNVVRRNSAYTFYVPRADGLLGVIVYAGGVEFWPAYFAVSASAGGTDAALALFDRSFDRDAFERRLAGRKVTVDIAEAIGQDVFLDPGKNARVVPRVDAIELQGSVLRLALTNTTSKRTVTLWFDVNTCQLIRSSIEGRLARVSRGKDAAIPASWRRRITGSHGAQRSG